MKNDEISVWCAGINQIFTVTFPLYVSKCFVYFRSLSNFALFIHPVFISKFKVLPDGERRDSNDPGKSLKEAEGYDDPREDGEKDTKATQGKDGEKEEEGNVEPVLDEDGDFDVTHRYGKTLVQSKLKHGGLFCEGGVP